MSKTNGFRALGFLLFTVVFVLFASTSNAQLTPGISCEGIGEEWFGVWYTTLVLTDRETGIVSNARNVSDTICAQDCFFVAHRFDDDRLYFEDEHLYCNLSIDGATVTLTCDWIEFVGPACNGNHSRSVVYTLDGTTITGVGHETIAFLGSCPGTWEHVFDLEFNMERIGGMEACAVPVGQINWGVLKGEYR